MPAAADAALACPLNPAADGHEPPCNPALARSPWAAAHRGSFRQASSALPAPTSASQISVVRNDFGVPTGAIPVIVSFSSRYPDGGLNLWSSVIEGADRGLVVKVDHETGELIDTYSRPDDEGGGVAPASTAGVYNLVDRRNHFINPRQQRIDIYGDSVSGDRFSPIALLARVEFPERALCRPSDGVIGIEILPSGRIAFATQLGMIGTMPSRVRDFNAANMRLLSLNGEDCANSEIADEDLEQVSNDVAGDEHSNLYVVSNQAQYKFSTDGGLQRVWRTPYRTGAGGGGARLDTGSGSTPTLMGTAPGDDRFVVITDGAKLMDLVLLWRGRIPRDTEPIAPGRPRRIACEVPVTFGDPQATESVSEQSVLVRGNASVVVNNRLAIDDAVGLLPQLPDNVGPLIALTGQDPALAPYGVERIDWNPHERGCGVVWSNPEISIPNGVPTMSSRTGLVYGIGQRNGTFGLEALDFDSGDSAFFAPSGNDIRDNSFFSATTIGPDGDVYTGTVGGLQIFRGPGSSKGLVACEVRWIGTRGADRFTGDGYGDLMPGRDGDDRMLGRGATDCLAGGAGDDLLAGGTGDDTLKAGTGQDSLRGGAGDDTLVATDGERDLLRCGPGNDTGRVDASDRTVGCERLERG